MQAKIVEACVESSMLFDCQARTWRVKEIKRMQGVVDRAYRYVWGNKNKPPLMQMREEGKNMEDVRKELGVRSLRWKIEKRVLERIGHVFRMEDGRLVKSMVLGWVEQLERWARVPGGRRKTVLYWRRLLREAGADVTRIGVLAADRKGWKAFVKERMETIAEWEESRGHTWMGGTKERVARLEKEVQWTCDVCDRVCKSKAGLTVHRRRMHEVSVLKKKFQCRVCGEDFKQEANLVNHRKICKEGSAAVGDRRRCDLCSKEVGKKSFAAHRRKCESNRGGEAGQQEPAPRARVYKALRKPCPSCGKEMASTNIQRHLREACQGGGAGP